MIRTSRQHHGPTFAGRRPIVWRALSLRRARSSPAARPSPSLRARHPRASRRDGFTLIELLVVIGIILLVAAITLSAVNMTISGDRIRGAARQVQSYLEGARDRAVYGGNTKGPGYQCGVRLIRDANNPSLVASMQFVEVDPVGAAITGGTYSLARLDDNGDMSADGPDVVRMLGTGGTNWYAKMQAGLVFDYQVVILGNFRYQIRTSRLSSTNEELLLTAPYQGTVAAMPAVTAVGSGPAYKLLLGPQPMANQEPRILGNGVVIDLNQSKGLASLSSNLSSVDIMFSPRGTVVGSLAATGIVELVISDRQDALLNAPIYINLWQPNTAYPSGSVVAASGGSFSVLYVSSGGTSGATPPNWVATVGQTTPDSGITWTCINGPKRERLVVSLTPQTGATAVHPLYVPTSPASPKADPFRYAETGEVARQ